MEDSPFIGATYALAGPAFEPDSLDHVTASLFLPLDADISQHGADFDIVLSFVASLMVPKVAIEQRLVMENNRHETKRFAWPFSNEIFDRL